MTRCRCWIARLTFCPSGRGTRRRFRLAAGNEDSISSGACRWAEGGDGMERGVYSRMSVRAGSRNVYMLLGSCRHYGLPLARRLFTRAKKPQCVAATFPYFDVFCNHVYRCPQPVWHTTPFS